MQLWRVFSSVIIVGSFLLPHFALAAEDECGATGTGEADVPEYIPGPESGYQLEQPFAGTDTVESIGEYIQLVYQFALGIIGIIAVVLIMFGGLRWISAAGNESIIGEAKEIITSAVTGLAIALLSYIILAFINPQTLKTDVAVFKIPIPLRCKDQPTLVPITSVDGLSGNGAQACPNVTLALQEVAAKMRTDDSATASYCPTCTIQVGSAYRTPESQEPLYECYTKCVDQEYINTDGTEHYKSGAPEGCGYCAKAAKPCCSNHNKGTAVDLYFSVGGMAGLMDIPANYAGDQTKNNGESGGDVNYTVDCTTRANPTLCASQKKLYDAMVSTGKFKVYDKEWWHFDLKSGECGNQTNACQEVQFLTHTVANNAYCVATKDDDTFLYRFATCTAGTSGCETFGGYTWYTESAGDCSYLGWNLDATADLTDTFTQGPSCENADNIPTFPPPR